MNKYFKKSTKRSVISILSIAITLCLLFSLLFQNSPDGFPDCSEKYSYDKVLFPSCSGST